LGVGLGLGTFFMLLGAVLAGAGIYTLLAARREAAGARSVWGDVLALEERTGRAGTIHCPRVGFTDAEGVARSFVSTVGGRPALHAPGQRVAVYYPEGHPERAELTAPAVLWLIPAGFIAAGLCFAGAGGFILLITVLASGR
jgi:hypothetical protein